MPRRRTLLQLHNQTFHSSCYWELWLSPPHYSTIRSGVYGVSFYISSCIIINWVNLFRNPCVLQWVLPVWKKWNLKPGPVPILVLAFSSPVLQRMSRKEKKLLSIAPKRHMKITRKLHKIRHFMMVKTT